MALIQLTTEELRTSAQKYTNGAEEVREVLRTLSNEQEIIRRTGKVSSELFRDQQFAELSQN